MIDPNDPQMSGMRAFRDIQNQGLAYSAYLQNQGMKDSAALQNWGPWSASTAGQNGNPILTALGIYRISTNQ